MISKVLLIISRDCATSFRLSKQCCLPGWIMSSRATFFGLECLMTGTLDTSFNPGTGGSFPCVFSLAVQADGKILVGGDFTTLGGQGRNSIGRLNADGTLDTSFNLGADLYVYCLAVQADGKILVGGQ